MFLEKSICCVIIDFHFAFLPYFWDYNICFFNRSKLRAERTKKSLSRNS